MGDWGTEGGGGGCTHGSGCGPGAGDLVTGSNGAVDEAPASLSSLSSSTRFLRALASRTSGASGNSQSYIQNLRLGITRMNNFFHKACERFQDLVHVIRVCHREAIALRVFS